MEVRARYTRQEEIVNAATHGLGTVLAILGSIVMTVFAARSGSGVAIASSIIYGLSMIVMYIMSTTYHAASREPMKSILQILDHASIFLLIAGCYTPLTLIIMGGSPKAIFLLIVVWTAAIIGITLNAKNMERYKRFSMVLYLLMGWAVVWALPEMVPLLGATGISLLVAGGVSYTVGIIFYKMKNTKYMHGIWHMFVLAGSVLHYLCILRYMMLL